MQAIDLGGGYALQPFGGKGTGTFAGYVERHPRPDDRGECSGVVYLERTSEPSGHHRSRWRLTAGTVEAPFTLEPSIRCRTCGAHWRLTNGKPVAL